VYLLRGLELVVTNEVIFVLGVHWVSSDVLGIFVVLNLAECGVVLEIFLIGVDMVGLLVVGIPVGEKCEVPIRSLVLHFFGINLVECGVKLMVVVDLPGSLFVGKPAGENWEVPHSSVVFKILFTMLLLSVVLTKLVSNCLNF
jgi:hypothetical protein